MSILKSLGKTSQVINSLSLNNYTLDGLVIEDSTYFSAMIGVLNDAYKANLRDISLQDFVLFCIMSQKSYYNDLAVMQQTKGK